MDVDHVTPGFTGWHRSSPQSDAEHRGAWVLTDVEAKFAARIIIEAEARLAIN